METSRKAITHARVTNGNDFPISDMYDGIPYTFPTGVAVRIPIDAAVVWFGMPVDINGAVTWKLDADSWATFSRRHGWTHIEPRTMPNGTIEPMNSAYARVTEEAAKKCSLIKVQPVSMILREVTEEEDALPEPRDTAVSGLIASAVETATAGHEKPGGKRGRQ